MSRCPTVVIETASGPVTINKSDFNEKEHKLAGQKATPKKKTRKAK